MTKTKRQELEDKALEIVRRAQRDKQTHGLIGSLSQLAGKPKRERIH